MPFLRSLEFLRIRLKFYREIQIFQPILLVMRNLKTCFVKKLYKQRHKVQVEGKLILQYTLSQVVEEVAQVALEDREVQVALAAEVEAQDQAQ